MVILDGWENLDNQTDNLNKLLSFNTSSPKSQEKSNNRRMCDLQNKFYRNRELSLKSKDL